MMKQSRLYFAAERCVYTFGDNTYRVLATFATVQLIFGLICLGDETSISQCRFLHSTQRSLLDILSTGSTGISLDSQSQGDAIYRPTTDWRAIKYIPQVRHHRTVSLRRNAHCSPRSAVEKQPSIARYITSTGAG